MPVWVDSEVSGVSITQQMSCIGINVINVCNNEKQIHSYSKAIKPQNKFTPKGLCDNK